MPEAVIVDAIRTPIGRAGKGSLKSVRADDLAAIPLRELIARNPELDPSSIDDIMMGCGFCEGEQGYNIGRVAGLLSGIDHHVPATTVNRFCASSLQTARMAAHAITAGEGDTYIAAGVEAVSRAGGGAPFEFNHAVDGSEGSAYDVYIPMGMTAENVADRCKVSRESQDEWAVISQNPQPIMMSSIELGSSSGLRAISSRNGIAARSSARTLLSDPLPARPMGVRMASTITASGMRFLLGRGPRGGWRESQLMSS